jgi:hypothetical protein
VFYSPPTMRPRSPARSSSWLRPRAKARLADGPPEGGSLRAALDKVRTDNQQPDYRRLYLKCANPLSKRTGGRKQRPSPQKQGHEAGSRLELTAFALQLFVRSRARSALALSVADGR